MSEINPVKAHAKRRRFSKAFKAKIVADCQQPGASVAGVALANGLNANMVHRWRRAAKPKTVASPEPTDFMPISVQERAPQADERAVVVLEVGSIKVHWPLSQIQHAIAWLRALQS
jgi:transposase-like protein